MFVCNIYVRLLLASLAHSTASNNSHSFGTLLLQLLLLLQDVRDI